MTNGFVFYRSFFDAIKLLPKTKQAIIYDAICNYALNDVEPHLSKDETILFTLIQPQIDANKRKRECGKLGGRPAKAEGKQLPKNKGHFDAERSYDFAEIEETLVNKKQ